MLNLQHKSFHASRYAPWILLAILVAVGAFQFRWLGKAFAQQTRDSSERVAQATSLELAVVPEHEESELHSNSQVLHTVAVGSTSSASPPDAASRFYSANAPAGAAEVFIVQTSQPTTQPSSSGLPRLRSWAMQEKQAQTVKGWPVPSANYPVQPQAFANRTSALFSHAQNQVNDATTRRIAETAAKLRSIPEEERTTELLEEFRELISAQFDRRHEDQQQRLQKILEDAKRMAAVLLEREEQKAQIVQRRVNELLGEPDVLNWDYQPRLPGDQRLSAQYQLVPADANVPIPSKVRRVPLTTGGDAEKSFPRAAPHLPSEPSASLKQPQGRPPLAEPARAAGEASPSTTPLASRNRYAAGLPGAAGMIEAEITTTEERNLSASPTTSDLIGLGFRLRGAAKQIELQKRQYLMGLVPYSDYLNLQNSLEEAKTRWEFKQRELTAQLRIAELAVQSAKQQVDQWSRVSNRTSVTNQKLMEAKQQLPQKEFELEQLVSQLDWMQQFEKDLPEVDAEIDSQQIKGEDRAPQTTSSENPEDPVDETEKPEARNRIRADSEPQPVEVDETDASELAR